MQLIFTNKIADKRKKFQGGFRQTVSYTLGRLI